MRSRTMEVTSSSRQYNEPNSSAGGACGGGSSSIVDGMKTASLSPSQSPSSSPLSQLHRQSSKLSLRSGVSSALSLDDGGEGGTGGASSSSLALEQQEGNGAAGGASSPMTAAADARRLVVEFLVVFAGLYVSWYGVRYLIENETGIENRPVPFQKTAAGDIILDSELNRPLVDPPTVPSGFLLTGSIYVPLFIVVVVSYCCTAVGAVSKRRMIHTVHASICGLMTAVAISEGATHPLKLYVQRRRPNFYALCGFDKSTQTCTASIEWIREANLSFPSGHSSLACSGMTYLVWFLLGMVISNSHRLLRAGRGNRPVNPRAALTLKRLLCLVSCAIPWGFAAFVGGSRIVDWWHHPSDVITGLVLGFVSGTVAYLIWFAPIVTAPGMPWSLYYDNHHQTSADATVLPQSYSKLPTFDE